MSPIDLALIAVIGLFTALGFFFGFIRTAGSLVGTILTIVLLFFGYDYVNQLFGGLFGSSFFTQATFFFTAFFLVSKLVGLVMWGVVKAFYLFKIIPFVGVIDRVGGLMLGLIEGLIFASVGSTFLAGMAHQLFSPEKIQATAGASILLPLFLVIGSMSAMFFPESIREQFQISIL